MDNEMQTTSDCATVAIRNVVSGPETELRQFWYSADTLRVVPESVLTALVAKEDT